MERKTILIADDAKVSRAILVHALKDEYDIIEAQDGEETLKKIVENYKSIAVVLLDINMPRIDGFQVMNALNRKNVMKYIPIILMTGDNSEENQKRGYEYGAVEFISKPVNVSVVKSRIDNVIKLYGEKNRLEMVNMQQNKLLLDQAERLKKLNSNIMDMIGSIIEFKTSESNTHIKRVKAFTKIMCDTVLKYCENPPIDEKAAAYIVSASCLHDIGKIMIPDSVLLKPSKLTDSEYEIVKSHTLKGCEILDAVSEYQEPEFYKYCYEICRYHHERYDGSGYPDNLKGNEIPISAQIVSIVEAFDALMTNSVYRHPIPFEKAFEMIENGSCGMFAPDMLHYFKLNKEKFREVDNMYSENAFF